MGIRKNQASLKTAERAAFVNAVKAVKSGGGYDTFVAQHLDAFLAGPNDPAHGGPGFLPWHREYLRRFERALQAIDPSVSLPYWDWTVDRLPTASLWADDFMGGNGEGSDERVTTGPFTAGQWSLKILDPGETRPFLRRSFGSMGELPTAEGVDSTKKITPYDSAPWNRQSNVNTSFRNRLEGVIHNPGHMWVGGSMMAMSSPNDPVFWLHHCNVDRLWAEWQQMHPTEGYLPPSGTPRVVPGHALDDPMPPWRAEPNPPTPRSVLDHHILGYSYDSQENRVGPVGVQESPFDDTEAAKNLGQSIRKVHVRSGNIVDAIQVFYGSGLTALPSHGGSGGAGADIVLDSGDALVEVSGYHGNWFGKTYILQLTFRTRKGKVYGPYGNMDYATTRTPFNLRAGWTREITAFFGSTASGDNGRARYLGSIGITAH